MQIIVDTFPREINLRCTCPDWAVLCKHVGAVLYRISILLDENPLLFFELRGIDVKQLLQKSVEDRIDNMLEKAKLPSSRVLSEEDRKRLFSI